MQILRRQWSRAIQHEQKSSAVVPELDHAGVVPIPGDRDIAGRAAVEAAKAAGLLQVP